VLVEEGALLGEGVKTRVRSLDLIIDSGLLGRRLQLRGWSHGSCIRMWKIIRY